MIRSSTALRALALAGATTVLLAACSTASSDGGGTEADGSSSPKADPAADCSVEQSTDPFAIGTMLPLTGTLAYLGPPAIAGVNQAIIDINEAGGVLDQPAEISTATDSGDSNDMSVSTNAATELIDAGVPVVVGAESSSVTLNVVDQLTSNCVVEISPANTAADLSGYSSYYYRTAPPDSVQGSALGQQIVADGNAKVAFIVFNDTYGTGLRDATQESIESAGGEVVYGASGQGQEFPPGQTTFSSEVSAATAADPDAIVILAFDETASIVPELVSAGWDMSKVYMSDGNTADYSEDFQPGTLEGAKGTIPGADASADFKAKLAASYQASEGAALDDYSYAAESYDAVILTARAAQAGGGTDAGTIQANMAAVSGADGGTECTTFAECLTALDAGDAINYRGISGIGPFNENNDPSSAQIGVYTFDADNAPVYTSGIEGAVQ